MVTKASILTYYKQNLKIIMETNFFDYISNKIPAQLRENTLLHLVKFFQKI